MLRYAPQTVYNAPQGRSSALHESLSVLSYKPLSEALRRSL